MFEIYYKNHQGQVLNLVGEIYRMQTADLFDYEWEPYTQSGFITAFEKGIVSRSAVLTITADSAVAYNDAIDHFYEVAEIDVLNMKPGRLYIGKQYMSCYIASSEKREWEYGIEQLDTEIRIYTDDPYWKKEACYEFKASQITSTDNKKYPNRYAHRYANGLTNTYITNEHFWDANFLLRIYGPCVNPMVAIDGHAHLLHIVLDSGEYVEVESKKGMILKTMISGQKVNSFHCRDKENDIFRKIPPGKKTINWPGKFNFDLILYEERGEPKWQSLEQKPL